MHVAFGPHTFVVFLSVFSGGVVAVRGKWICLEIAFN